MSLLGATFSFHYSDYLKYIYIDLRNTFCENNEKCMFIKKKKEDRFTG